MEPNTQDLLDRLDEVNARGLSWTEIARRAGMSAQALRKIRAGEAAPRLTTARSLEFVISEAGGAPPRAERATEVLNLASGPAILLAVKRPMPMADLRHVSALLQDVLDAYSARRGRLEAEAD